MPPSSDKKLTGDRWLARHLLAEAPHLVVGVGALICASFVNFRTSSQLRAAIEATPATSRSVATRGLLLFTFGAAAGCIRTFIFDSTVERIRCALAVEVFAARLRAEPACLPAPEEPAGTEGAEQEADANSGKIRSSAAMDASDVQVCAELALKLQNVIRYSASVVGGTGAMFYASWRLSSVVWPVLVVGCLHGARSGAKRGSKSAKRVAEAREKALGFAEERLEHRDLVRWFQRADAEASDFQELCKSCIAVVKKSARDRGVAHFVLDLAGKGVLMGLCNIGTQLVRSGELTTGQLTQYMIHSGMLGLGLYGLVGLAPEIMIARDAANRLTAALAAANPEAVDFEPAAVPLPVRFEDVSFMHGKSQVLNGFSLEIPAGSTCALVGSSGSGKSTALSLLLRDVDPQGGRILVGDKEVSTLSRGELRAKLGVSPQQPSLLGPSVHQSIAFGMGSQSVADHDVQAAARMACAHDFVMARPGDYSSAVGHGGAQLSGGERQRLSLARALIRGAPVLLLDEPTSALDATTAEEFSKAVLAERPRRPTTLVVTHSLALIRRCEKVAVLSKDGRIVQCGEYAKLIADSQGPLAEIMKAGELVDDSQ